jgi:autotransporter-associated beta strand protein
MKRTCLDGDARWLLLIFLCVAGTGAFAAGGNYSDRIDFGNAASEAAHNFNFGLGGVPQGGVGAFGQTFRAPVGGGPGAGSNTLSFNLAVSPTQQNYLTVRMWGNDKTTMRLWLQGADDTYLSGTETPAGETTLTSGLASLDANNVDGGEAAPFPNRFYYDTYPIPYVMTCNRTNVALVLYENTTANTTLPAGPVYSAYSQTDPHFVPDGNDPTGTPLPLVGQSNLVSLALNQVVALLQTNRQNIYVGSSGYFTNVLQRQILPGTADNPPTEVIGLDLFNTVSSWTNSNPNASPDTWRNYIASQAWGPGYTACPDELLSVLISTFTLPPFTNASGNVVSGLDHYHDTNLLTRIFYALDGCTYMQDSDGGYVAQGGGISANQYGYWTGICSSPRTNASNPWVGTTNREPTTWGGGALEGVDSFTVGWTVVQMLNDPVAYPVFTNWLAQSYKPDFTTNMLRAYAYERMFYNYVSYAQTDTGGAESQNMFSQIGGYAAWIALVKLQQIYTNAAYAPTNFYGAKMVLGLYPDSILLENGQNTTATGYTNYGMSAAGFGEQLGVLSCGYDGRYGSMLPWLAPWFVRLAALDPNMDPATLSNVQVKARAAINGYDQFISPGENYHGTNDYFTFAQEDYITYRKPYNPNSDGNNFFVNTTFIGSDPSLGIQSPFALRSAYLGALYGRIPTVYETQNPWGDGYNAASRTDYLKSLSSYEATLRSLVNVSPTNLTSLPGEPGQPNHAFVDPQTGVTAVYYNGERLFLNPNYRSYLNTNSVTVSDLARIHDTAASQDIAAMVLLPYNSATVQSDGNLSGGPQQPWVVRFGQWLIAGNPTTSSSTLQLPAGNGTAIDLISSNTYGLGSTLTLAANQAVAVHLPLATSVQPLANGTYAVSNLLSKLVLDVPGGSTVPGTQMDQTNSTGGNLQKWLFTWNGSGYYTISNVASGLFLDNPAGSTNSGLALDQQSASGGDNQLWQLVSSGSGYNLKNKFSGLLADIVGSATNTGTLLDLETDSADVSQAWQLVPVTASAATLQPVPNGTNALVCAVSGLALANTNNSANTQLTQATPAGGNSQKWIFTYAGGGYYTIQNAGSGYYLTDPSGSTSAGVLMQQQVLLTGSSTNNQLWQLIPNGTGITLVNRAGGLVIDDPGSSTSSGVAIDLYSWNGGANQVWLLASASGTPTGLSAAGGVGTVQLNWTAATNFPTGYNIKRSTTNGGSYTLIASAVTDTTFIDTSVKVGTNYYYVVSSTNSFGESANSTQASAAATGLSSLLVWRGNVSTNWDAATANWLQAGVSAVYADGSAVWFDDTASSNTVNLAASVKPGSVTFNNSALDYLVNSFGANGINGTNALIKMGNGTLELAGTNIFSGGLTIMNGAVQSDNTNALGTGAITLGDGVSANSATLLAAPASVTFGNNNPVVVAAGGSGLYEIQFTGGKDYHLSGGIALNNALTISTTSGGAIFVDGVITSGVANPLLTIDGAGTTSKFVDLTANNAATFTGSAIVVNSGDLKSGNVNSLSATNTIYLDPTATFDNGSQNLTIAGLNDYGIGGGTVADAGNGVMLTLAGGGNCMFSGVINNIGGILKTNTGTQILSGANTFTGPVTVSQGKLVISTLHLGNNVFTVTNGATLGVTNLGNVQSASIYSLTLGSAVPTTLEFQNVSNTALPLIVVTNVALKGACIVLITGTNNLTSGGTYPLVDYSGAFTGTFGNFTLQMPSGWAGILVSNAPQIAVAVVAVPAAPAGLTATAGNALVVLNWSAVAGATGYNVKSSTTNGGRYTAVGTNVNSLTFTNTGLVNGMTYYYVVTATNAAGESASSAQAAAQPVSLAPPQLAYVVSGNQFQFNWPADHLGWTLRVQTNALNAGLGTNWMPVAGSSLTNQMSFPISPANSCVFFRLTYP